MKICERHCKAAKTTGHKTRNLPKSHEDLPTLARPYNQRPLGGDHLRWGDPTDYEYGQHVPLTDTRGLTANLRKFAKNMEFSWALSAARRDGSIEELSQASRAVACGHGSPRMLAASRKHFDAAEGLKLFEAAAGFDVRVKPGPTHTPA